MGVVKQHKDILEHGLKINCAFEQNRLERS
jgi:hypothetical protein